MPSIANKLFFTAALAVLGASMSAAQACSMLADPNSPECKNGTGPVRAGANLPSAQQAAPAARHAADAPGRGQQVCAFFDTRTNRCLTVRPNTKAYDDAVQTGVDAAMMGIQIQQDALRRAAEIGVTPGGGLPGSVSLPTIPKQPERALPPPTNLPAPSPRYSDAQTSPPIESRLMSCIQSRAEKESERKGRKLTSTEIQSIVDECE